MRVLQINSDYKNSSTGKITESLHELLTNKGVESFVIYGRKNKNEAAEKKVFASVSVYYSKLQHLLCNLFSDPYGFCFLSTTKIIHMIRRIKPEIVHIQCINGYFLNVYKLLEWLGQKKIKTVLTMHAEFLYTGGCDHAFDCSEWINNFCHNCTGVTNCRRRQNSFRVFQKLEKAFSFFDSNNIRIVAVSHWLEDRAKLSPIIKRFRVSTIMNGVNVSTFHYYENDIFKIRPKILFVTAGFNPDQLDNKGGRFVVEIANELIKRNVDLSIIVVASSGIITGSLPPNVEYLGKITNQEQLARLYSEASATLILSKRETFCMPVAESMCCGTYVVGFLSGGPESIAIKEFSSFFDYGNVNSIVDLLCSRLHTKDDKERISQIAKKHYSQERMFNQYYSLYTELIRG